MHKSFGFHVFLPAQSSFGCSSPGVSAGYFPGAYPTYSFRSLLSRQDCLFSYRPAPIFCGPSFSWEIRFLTCEEYMKWHFITQIPAEQATKTIDDHKHLLSEAAPQAVACPWQGQSATCTWLIWMEHVLSHPSILAGMLHSITTS